MTEQEYIAALNRIYHSETGEEPAETERLLERLYTVKPVRLSWYTAKAKNVWENSRSWKAVFPILANKGWYLFPYPGIQELAELYMDLVSSYRDITDMQRNKLMYLNICADRTKEDEEWAAQIHNRFQQKKLDFINHPESTEIAGQLLDYYFI